VGFPDSHDTATARLMGRLFGVRDIGLGVLALWGLSRPEVLPFLLLFNAFMDLGDLVATGIPLVKRQGIDKGGRDVGGDGADRWFELDRDVAGHAIIAPWPCSGQRGRAAAQPRRGSVSVVLVRPVVMALPSAKHPAFWAATDLTPELVADDDARISPAQFCVAWAELLRATRPEIALAIADAMPAGAFGIVEYVCRSAPTVRDALLQWVRYLNLLDDAVVVGLAVEGDRAYLRVELESEAPAPGAHELCFALVAQRIRQFSAVPFPDHGGRARPSQRGRSGGRIARGSMLRSSSARRSTSWCFRRRRSTPRWCRAIRRCSRS
jgi:hypothetical protein